MDTFYEGDEVFPGLESIILLGQTFKSVSQILCSVMAIVSTIAILVCNLSTSSTHTKYTHSARFTLLPKHHRISNCFIFS